MWFYGDNLPVDCKIVETLAEIKFGKLEHLDICRIKINIGKCKVEEAGVKNLVDK